MPSDIHGQGSPSHWKIPGSDLWGQAVQPFTKHISTSSRTRSFGRGFTFWKAAFPVEAHVPTPISPLLLGKTLQCSGSAGLSTPHVLPRAGGPFLWLQSIGDAQGGVRGPCTPSQPTEGEKPLGMSCSASPSPSGLISRLSPSLHPINPSSPPTSLLHGIRRTSLLW